MALGRWTNPKIGSHSVAMENVDGQNPGGSAEQVIKNAGLVSDAHLTN
jgi:hypothetical protein